MAPVCCSARTIAIAGCRIAARDGRELVLVLAGGGARLNAAHKIHGFAGMFDVGALERAGPVAAGHRRASARVLCFTRDAARVVLWTVDRLVPTTVFRRAMDDASEPRGTVDRTLAVGAAAIDGAGSLGASAVANGRAGAPGRRSIDAADHTARSGASCVSGRPCGASGSTDASGASGSTDASGASGSTDASGAPGSSGSAGSAGSADARGASAARNGASARGPGVSTDSARTTGTCDARGPGATCATRACDCAGTS